jgi:hypothetical protein
MRRLLLLILFGLLLSPLVGKQPAVSAQTPTGHQLVSVTGYTLSGDYGTRVDITLDVPPGSDSAALAQDALAHEGAQPVAALGTATQLALPVLRWPQFFTHDPGAAVRQYYNPAHDPTVSANAPGGALPALQADEQAWTGVPTATYGVQYAGTTTRGAGFDGVNTVSWPTTWVHSPQALAVTTTTFFFSSGFILDADIELNGQNFQFFANPADLTPKRVDVRYVLLHENGHVAGLPHSPNPAAVMFAFFGSGIVGHGLSDDDIDAISTRYPHDYPPLPQPPHKLQGFSATYSGSSALTGATTAAYRGTGTGTYVGQSQLQGTMQLFPFGGG